MSDRYTFSDHPMPPEWGRNDSPEPSIEERARWHAEIAFERPLIDDDAEVRHDRWRVEMAAVLLDRGIPVRQAGEIASALVARLKEPL